MHQTIVFVAQAMMKDQAEVAVTPEAVAQGLQQAGTLGEPVKAAVAMEQNIEVDINTQTITESIVVLIVIQQVVGQELIVVHQPIQIHTPLVVAPHVVLEQKQ